MSQEHNPDQARAGLRVALEGCGHGKLHDIYAKVGETAASKGWDGVDLLIIGGDFQSVRNANDLTAMSVPIKYREIGDFHDYYSGKRVAPYLTLFIGGNHEASNYLRELYYGGWVAPNIYFVGAANVLRYGPLRIAGLSGIYKGYDYRKSHFERLPYNADDVKSIYHVREIDVRKLLQVRTQVDVGLSHDWPRDAEKFGDSNRLFRIKRGFREDSESGKLGNVAAKKVLDRLRPRYWFSAHLHVRYSATIPHGDYVYQKNSHSTETTSKRLQTSSPHGLDGATVSLPSDMTNMANEEDREMGGVLLENKKSPPVPFSTQINGLVPPKSAAEAHLAWNQFPKVAAQEDALDGKKFLENAPRPGETYSLDVDFSQTWKKVQSGDLDRKVTNVQKAEEKAPVKNADEIDLDLDDDKSSANISETEAEKGKNAVKNTDEIDLDLDSGSEGGASIEVKKNKTPNPTNTDNVTLGRDDNEVPVDLREQLPEGFKRQRQPSASYGPLPDEISNKATEFLALGKCQNNFACSEYLEILEIAPASEGIEAQGPYTLQYDKEWLAITRVFADSLAFGDPSFQIPPDLGDEVYKPKILAEEAWVQENIVDKGKMDVPQNFEITAPIYDPAVSINTTDMPPEYNNNQTAAFCELVGIENKFHLTPEEQEQRRALEPRPSHSFHGHNRHRIPRQGRNNQSGRGGGRRRGGYSGGYNGGYNGGPTRQFSNNPHM
ncbi:Lariat debranching enzyme [Talaromyces islandicus]|uniref:Lariat debranching enzyme n=1 Tax=Talaromyces islandicus TaxID=28573 RepID=A0A0U1LLH4_TALIS|nr:Lariat debranching enzyme [Talaromyces islandicus]